MARRKTRKKSTKRRGLSGTTRDHAMKRDSDRRVLVERLKKARVAVKDGECTVAFAHLRIAARVQGRAMAHAMYAGGKSSHQMPSMTAYDAITKRFTARCLVRE